jgi:hypothetical protein
MIASLFISSESKTLEEMKINPFKLPIQYLNEKRELSDSVACDLELSVQDISCTTMYHYLLKPKTQFEEKMIPLWVNTYTTNTDFLEETQTVIKSVDSLSIESPDYESIMKIWKSTKEDPYFLERYSYMEIEMFEWVNKLPSFLQAISVVNMASPILGFFVPIIFLFIE